MDTARRLNPPSLPAGRYPPTGTTVHHEAPGWPLPCGRRGDGQRPYPALPRHVGGRFGWCSLNDNGHYLPCYGRRKMGESNQQILEEIRAERVQLEKVQAALEHPRREGATCGAKTSAGNACRRSPIRGGTKCCLHGGGSPLARQAAERRLLYGVSHALDRLIDAVSEHEHEGPCEACGCNPSSRDPNTLRAAIALLDRSGFGPGLTLRTEEEEVRVGEVRVTIVEPDRRNSVRPIRGFRSRSCKPRVRAELQPVNSKNENSGAGDDDNSVSYLTWGLDQ